jgi:hypothetical protein
MGLEQNTDRNLVSRVTLPANDVVKAYKSFPTSGLDGIETVEKKILPQFPVAIVLNIQTSHKDKIAAGSLFPDDSYLLVQDRIGSCVKQLVSDPRTAVQRCYLDGIDDQGAQLLNFFKQGRNQLSDPKQIDEVDRKFTRYSPALTAALMDPRLQIMRAEDTEALSKAEALLAERNSQSRSASATILGVALAKRDGLTAEQKAELDERLSQAAGTLQSLELPVWLKDPDRANTVLENRESKVVPEIAAGDRAKGLFAIAVFGDLHDFKNNIEEWNKANPHRQLALIVLTPQGLTPARPANKKKLAK